MINIDNIIGLAFAKKPYEKATRFSALYHSSQIVQGIAPGGVAAFPLHRLALFYILHHQNFKHRVPLGDDPAPFPIKLIRQLTQVTNRNATSKLAVRNTSNDKVATILPNRKTKVIR